MWVSNIPNVIAAGTTIKWRDEETTVPFDQQVTSSDWTLKYYLRSTDLELTIQVELPVSIEIEGKVCLPIKTLLFLSSAEF